MKNIAKVFVAMSGGVDSSVAALLLKRRSYDVAGVFMRCYNIDGCAERDAEDARRVAAKLGIPFYVWDFEKEYKKRVVGYMIEGYKKGITPNPDVMCNREIKFGLFLEKALEMGADYVATGHYARIKNQELRIKNEKNSPFTIHYSLFTARDAQKDQSYFLWTLTQKQLKYCLFPTGDYLKSEVREIARKAGLPTAEKKDSQGICFLGQVTLADFLKEYIPEKRGAVLAASGEKLGEHNGSHFYTIGQRHIGVANRKSQSAKRSDFKPLYVVEKDIKSNTLTVVEGGDHPALYKKEADLTGVNFIAPAYSNVLKNIRIRKKGMRVLARVRYRQPLVPATLSNLNNPHKSAKSALIRVLFDKPQKFVAPGQSAVFYGEEGELLGGGVII